MSFIIMLADLIVRMTNKVRLNTRCHLSEELCIRFTYQMIMYCFAPVEVTLHVSELRIHECTSPVFLPVVHNEPCA